LDLGLAHAEQDFFRRDLVAGIDMTARRGEAVFSRYCARHGVVGDDVAHRGPRCFRVAVQRGGLGEQPLAQVVARRFLAMSSRIC
jgi:hypothetical protein